MKEVITISQEDGVVRIDKYISSLHPEYSRAAIAKLFDLQLIKRGGIPLRPGEKVRPGSSVEYDLGPLQSTPEVIDLPILYEDENVIVVDKPAGIISHARGRYWQEASVASFIRSKVTEELKSPPKEGTTPLFDRAGIVHRLDRATSGVMICAKNTATLSFLQKQFHDRKVSKTYIAITSGVPKHSHAVIDAPIKRNEKDPKKFFVHPDGKSAQTEYVLLKADDRHALIELKPKTGRTHQLRVHLRHIGTPIVGDELYGTESSSRLLLHAATLTITLPNGELKTFSSPLPQEFSNYVGS